MEGNGKTIVVRGLLYIGSYNSTIINSFSSKRLSPFPYGVSCMVIEHSLFGLESESWTLVYMWCATHEKGPYAVCGQSRPRSACAFAQAELGLRCPLIASMDTASYVDEQRMLRSDCTDVHADLDLRCSHII